MEGKTQRPTKTDRWIPFKDEDTVQRLLISV